MLRLPVQRSDMLYFLSRHSQAGKTASDGWRSYLVTRGKQNSTKEQLNVFCANASGLAIGNVNDRCRHFFRTLNNI